MSSVEKASSLPDPPSFMISGRWRRVKVAARDWFLKDTVPDAVGAIDQIKDLVSTEKVPKILS